MKRLLTLMLLTALVAHGEPTSRSNIVWDSPSKDSLDSMPLSGRLGAGASLSIFNLEIYQEGTVSPGTVKMFREAHRNLDTK
jgi:hypothetical protein